MHKFSVGDKAKINDQNVPVFTIQFVRDESVVCSYLKDGLIYTVELNPVLLKLLPPDHGKPAQIENWL